MFLLWPIRWYHSLGDLIWSVGPFNMFMEQCVNILYIVHLHSALYYEFLSLNKYEVCIVSVEGNK